MKNKIGLLKVITGACLFVIIFHSSNTMSQCVQCFHPITTGLYSSAIGYNNSAGGDNSFVGGKYSIANGNQSFAIGDNITINATGINSFAFGLNTTIDGAQSLAFGENNSTGVNGSNSFVGGYQSQANGAQSFCYGTYSQAIGVKSIVLGTYNTAQQTNTFSIGTNLDNVVNGSIIMGYGASNVMNRLTNEGAEPNSFMIGTLSTKPTFYIGQSPGSDKTGKVGIGNVLAPIAKLHIRADQGEEASIFLEPEIWWDGAPATIYLGTQEHGVTAHSDLGLIFQSANNYLFSEGNIGMGVDDPSTKLEIVSNVADSYAAKISNNVNFGKGLLIKAGAQEITDNPILDIHIGSGLSIFSITDSKVSTSREFISTEDIITSERVIVGNVSDLVSGYKLYVEQGILTEKVKVAVPGTTNWSDHVFNKDYQLKSISELEKFIQNHGHLPGIPSADEVVEEGVDLLQMNAKLLEKIEELTLYIIEQQKQIDALKNNNK